MSQECGCRIEWDHLPGKPQATFQIIVYCPLHASAGELLKALKSIAVVSRRKLVGREAGAEARLVIRQIADEAISHAQGEAKP